MSITAIIPVREGSRRLKNKNIAPFAGTNLLCHKINQLKRVREIDKIVVSSDSDRMLAMAKNEGVEYGGERRIVLPLPSNRKVAA